MLNKEIAAKFREMRALLKQQGETNDFRLRAYDRAADVILLMDKQLVDVWVSNMAGKPEQALKDYCSKFQGVGDKSLFKIKQFLQTGTCDEYDQLMANRPVVQESFLDETMVAPPTKRKASANLREEVTATRRPREQAQEVVDRVIPVISKYFELVEICGSWRRGRADIKDIDIAISKPRAEWAKEPVELLFTRVEKDLKIGEHNVVKRGNAQTAFYAESPFGDWHVDFWYVPEQSWGGAILFATGSMEFNVEMRTYVKALGLKLNRYGICAADSSEKDRKVLAGRTEEEIFDYLGMRWVPPVERVHFDRARYLKKAS